MQIGIKQVAAAAGFHSGPPPGARYTNPKERAGELQHELGTSEPPNSATLTNHQREPLAESRQLESGNSHGKTIVNWKGLFKPGDEFVLHGVRFIFHRTGRRDLHLRLKR